MPTQEQPTMEDIFGPVISSYSRAQGIEDGILVDVTEWASAEKGFLGGFTCPVAVTRSVWSDLENIPPSKKGWQDLRGRAHDLLFMASLAARKANSKTGGVLFGMILYVGRRSKQVYKLHAGPGDDGKLVITISQRNED